MEEAKRDLITRLNNPGDGIVTKGLQSVGAV